MRILVFADTRFPIERANGVQTMATCHALAARGHDVTLVVRPDSASPARDPFAFYGHPRLDRLRIHPVGRVEGLRARRAAFLAQAVALAATRPDALIYTRDLGVASLLTRLPAGRRGPVVYESHGVSVTVAEELPRLLGQPDEQPSRRKLARLDRRERRVWRHAEAFVTITRALQHALEQRHGPRDRVFVVADGADIATPAAPLNAAVPTAAYAGHLYPWKGVDVFVEALALAPAVRGLIVGGHPGERDLARIQERSRELGLGARLIITGLVAPRDVASALAPATMLVLPNTRTEMSAYYTSPLKMFEYLALGRPIIASDLPAIREVLDHERTALLVPPGDPAALAAALSRLAADPALAARLGAAARALAPDYTWARRAERLEAAFSEAAAR